MNGIDIYNGQRGLKLSTIKDLDFVIVKATEGIGLVDKSCDNFIEQAKKLNLLWGFYHYAKNNAGKFDADYFYTNTKNYFGNGIPFLDYEDPSLLKSGKGIQYCEDFCSYIYNKTNIYPVIYTSAAVAKTFKNSWIPQKCNLWLAGYPLLKKYTYFDAPKNTYDIAPWERAIIWQYTGNAYISGYNLDLDVSNLTRDEWLTIAKGKQVMPVDNLIAACKVILGDYGTGDNRKKAIEREGLKYREVQQLVNKIMKL